MERHVIVGTAGHIDHGKTTLIKALTGRDTDRLKEEKERGITIDLGFTWMDLPDKERVGIIDVPGHEKFISNMTAGVVGMDLVLLVIAADEGVMPQTREHLAILRLLGVENILVVLNKCDLVDEEWLEMVEQQIKEEFQHFSGEGQKNEQVEDKSENDVDIIRVSARTGVGIEELKSQILKCVNKQKEMWKTPAFPRLPVDRVFSIKGSGTVVTGTLLGGEIHTGAQMMVYPQQTPCRVRGIQVHEKEMSVCEAGQRSALNLVQTERKQSSDGKFVYRGNVIAPEGSMKVSRYVNARLTLLPQSKRSIEHQTRLHFYSGTTEVLCRAVPLSCEKVEPGESAYVQLRLEEEAAFCEGDRFVVRFYSPLETIGGGIILEMGEQKERRFHDRILQRLEILEKSLCGQEGTQSRESSEAGQNLQEQIHLEKKIMDELESWLSDHPYRRGMPKSVLFNQISKGKKEKNQEIQKCLLLLEEHEAVCCRKSDNKGTELIFPMGYKVKETEAVSEIRRIFCSESAGKIVFFLNRTELEICLASGNNTKKKNEKQNRTDLIEILDYLKDEKEIIEIREDLYTTTDTAFRIKTEISKLLCESKVITLSQIKEVFQTSRKNARLIFEYTDRIGLTVKEGAETERTAGKKLIKEQIRGKRGENE
nr:selenocysteine-specific translation elongation factor [uncultured Mediterraneibacter sp.]